MCRGYTLDNYPLSNLSKRKQPAPQYWNKAYSLPRIAVSISKEGEWNSSDLKESIAAAQAEVDTIFIALGKEFDEALAKYRELDSIAPEQS